MAVMIGSARSSYGNTKAGDQAGGKEVSTQAWYAHSKGWVLLRAKDPHVRELIAVAMERACANNLIGYSQDTRNTLRDNIKNQGFDPAKTSKAVNTDCSALVRVCCNFAGIEVGNFITSTETNMLMATGKFEKFTDARHCKSPDYLMRGDILNTKTKGHTVVVLSCGAKANSVPVATKHTLGDRLLKNGSDGEDVKELQEALIQLGFSCGAWGADGEYGDATEIAVTIFQRSHGLEADGDYGPLTHAQLLSALEKMREPAITTCVRIEGGNCYVRSNPNTEGKKLGVAYKEQILPFIGEVSVAGWLKVNFIGQDGWVSGKYGKLCG